MSYAPTELHPHASKDKYDVIDWEHLPVGECDMNYRLDENELSDSSEMQGGLFCGPLFALLLYGCIVAIGREYSLFMVGSLGRVSFLAVLLGVIALARARSSTGFYRGITIMFSTFVAGTILLIAGGALNLPERLVALLVATLVGLTWIADSIATTNAWWCTANPRVEGATMTAYRQAWRKRWLADPPPFEKQPPIGSQLAIARSRIGAQLSRYRLGVLWLYGAIFAGALIGLITARLIGTPLIAVSVIVQTTAILLFVVSARMANASSVPLRSLRLAVNRHIAQNGSPYQPPWVLQLPRGPAWSRELQIILIVSVIAFMCVATVAKEVLPSAHGLLLPISLVSLSAFVAPIWATCGILIVAGPTIIAHSEALEISGAFEQVARTDWDGYVARLRQSRNPLERRCIWTGCSLAEGYPILVDRKLYFEHVHVVGSTGMGKTALSLTSDLIQLIRNNSGEDAAGGIVIIDCKGDPALLHTAREEAAAAGRTFKWFTNQPNVKRMSLIRCSI